jgi:hypothetical protein
LKLYRSHKVNLFNLIQFLSLGNPILFYELLFAHWERIHCLFTLICDLYAFNIQLAVFLSEINIQLSESTLLLFFTFIRYHYLDFGCSRLLSFCDTSTCLLISIESLLINVVIKLSTRSHCDLRHNLRIRYSLSFAFASLLITDVGGRRLLGVANLLRFLLNQRLRLLF